MNHICVPPRPSSKRRVKDAQPTARVEFPHVLEDFTGDLVCPGEFNLPRGTTIEYGDPMAVLAATILCGSGALAALWITGTTLNISSFMGAIMVVGIVHKNGILMLDSEQYFSEKGFELREAIFHAGRRRLRPIVMTALATIFGMAPLAVGVGSGAQLLKPLATAVIGGVSVSMVLSLLITPVLYYLLRQRGL